MYLQNRVILVSWLVFVVGVGVACLSLFPKFALFVSGIAFITLALVISGRKLSSWQFLSFIALLGYTILGYGFANFAFRLGGVPLPLGHVLTFGAILLTAFFVKTRYFRTFLKEPVTICWLLLLALSLLHLLFDVSRFGAYAIRDSSFVVEGVALFLGFLWARRIESTALFLRLLFILFLLNFIYSLTFPFREVLIAHSPTSGVFLEVPVLGFYGGALFLVVGGLFYLLFGERISKLPSFVVLSLALLQLGWSFLFQARSMYVGIVVALFMVLLFGTAGKVLKVTSGVVISVVSLFLFISSFNVNISGRLGPIEPGFFVSHFESIFLKPGTPGEGSARWRLELLSEIWDRWTSSKTTILVGEGFGEPIIDFSLGEVAVRQPHNTHLTVLVRLGLIGMVIWVILHYRIISLFFRGIKFYPKGTFEYNVVLWFFIFYVLGMLLTTVQPWLEFSYGAIPFYMLIGFALGFIKRDTERYRSRLKSGQY